MLLTLYEKCETNESEMLFQDYRIPYSGEVIQASKVQDYNFAGRCRALSLLTAHQSLFQLK